MEQFTKKIVELDMLYKFKKKTYPHKLIFHSSTEKMLVDKSFVQAIALCTELVTGNKAIPTKARKPIANFNLRKKMTIGIKTTLRKKKLYEFLKKCVYIYFPRRRDSIFSSLSKFSVWNHNINDTRAFLEIQNYYQYFERFSGILLDFSVHSEKEKNIIKVYLSAYCLPQK